MSTSLPSKDRDYNSISPSAKALLLLKGATDIPYARNVAALISRPEQYEPDFDKKDFIYWARMLHFENRYKSIDQLLEGLNIHNVLELSSGFSFRGLYTVMHDNIHYIDTDLPDLVNTKKELMAEVEDTQKKTTGKLELLPLNAVDEAQFKAVAGRFAPGALVIVNEGLLMYLGMEEKKKLCSIIREILTQRGGYWITSDVYIKAEKRAAALDKDDKLQQFFDKHHINDNMFESFEEAAAFFKEEGFVVDKEATTIYQQLGAFKYLLASASEEQLVEMGKAGKIQATWRLRLA